MPTDKSSNGAITGTLGEMLSRDVSTPTDDSSIEARALKLIRVMFPSDRIAGPFGYFFLDYLQSKHLWSFDEIVFWLSHLAHAKSDNASVARYRTEWEFSLLKWRAEIRSRHLTLPLMSELRRAVAGGQLKAKEVDGEFFVNWEEAIKWWFRYLVPDKLWQGKRTSAATAAKTAIAAVKDQKDARLVHAIMARNKNLSRHGAAIIARDELVMKGEKPRGVKTIENAAKNYPPDRKTVVKP